MTIFKSISRLQTQASNLQHPLKPKSGLKIYVFCSLNINLDSQNFYPGYIQGNISFRQDISLLDLFPYGRKKTNRPIDIKEIHHYFELVYKHHRNASKKVRKIFHIELEVSPCKSTFSKEMSQITRPQTCRKFWIILS